jgi:DNA-directed RNA polymerase
VLVRKRKHGLGLLDEAVAALSHDAPEELKRAAPKVVQQQANLERAEGFGATAAGQAIAERWLPTLIESIEGALAARTRSQLYVELFEVLRGLPSEVLALSILQTALDTIAQNETKVRSAALSIADAIAGECWMRDLIKERPDLAEREQEAIELGKKFRRERFSSKRKQQMTLASVKRAGYSAPQWDVERRAQAGMWAINQLLGSLSDVFDTAVSTEKGGPERLLVLTDNARDYARDVLSELIRRNPVWLPQTEPPLCWTDLDKGGPSDKRLSLIQRVISRHSKRNDAAVREAIRDGTMQSTLGALNVLQNTAWTINRPVLEVLNRCAESEIGVPGGPPLADFEVPILPAGAWHSMDDDARQQWLRKIEEVEKKNRKRRSKRVLLDQDRETANTLVKYPRFWTPMHLDWRGRVYSVPHFSYPREDYVRGLFLFADGEPIGEEGRYWLKVHLANCADSEALRCKGISKRPFIERVAWVEKHRSEIESIAATPLTALRWTKAGEPFQFLAACFELVKALAEGPTYVSHLPISFDGSCSGLQHLSAMMKDRATAELANLTDNPLPQDLYQTVAESVCQRVENDVENIEDAHLRQMWLEYGIDRKVVKRNVMTYSYGSNVEGMVNQLVEDLMDRLPPENPFGDKGRAASWYLARHTYAAIKATVPLPADAMRYLKKLARALAKENKPVRWTTPVGFPFVNQYSKPDIKRIKTKLWLHDQGTRVNKQHIIKTTIDELPGLDEHEAQKGAAPNFVHACDAAHLMLTVNAAAAEGITSIATVHDSFGCLPSQAERFRHIIRKQFVRMYEEHDVLAEVLEWARKDLSEPNTTRLPPGPPQKGSLNINEVLKAEFAFA